MQYNYIQCIYIYIILLTCIRLEGMGYLEPTLGLQLASLPQSFEDSAGGLRKVSAMVSFGRPLLACVQMFGVSKYLLA